MNIYLKIYLQIRDGGGPGRPAGRAGPGRDFRKMRRAGPGRAAISKLYKLLILNKEFPMKIIIDYCNEIDVKIDSMHSYPSELLNLIT